MSRALRLPGALLPEASLPDLSAAFRSVCRLADRLLDRLRLAVGHLNHGAEPVVIPVRPQDRIGRRGHRRH